MSPPDKPRARPAFSLVEVMVAVAVLSVIVIGLLMVFNQTQRAFRGSITQTDVLESGRAATEMLSHELEQAVPAHSYATVFFVTNRGTPLPQVLPPPADNVRRANVLQDVFFLVCANQQWTAIGYRVEPADAGAGTLYRFSTNLPAAEIWRALNLFISAPAGSLQRVMDGVIDFRVRAYDPNGYWIRTNGWFKPAMWVWVDPVSGESGYWFWSNALPAAVELQLGIVEAPVLERFRALTNNLATARSFLSDRVAGVHLFRQRIAIRNVDPQAYQ